MSGGGYSVSGGGYSVSGGSSSVSSDGHSCRGHPLPLGRHSVARKDTGLVAWHLGHNRRLHELQIYLDYHWWGKSCKIYEGNDMKFLIALSLMQKLILKYHFSKYPSTRAS